MDQSLFFLIHYFLGLTEDCYNFKHLFLLYMYYLSLVLHWKVYVLLEMTVLVTVSDRSTVTDGGRLIYRITPILSFLLSKPQRQKGNSSLALRYITGGRSFHITN